MGGEEGADVIPTYIQSEILKGGENVGDKNNTPVHRFPFTPQYMDTNCQLPGLNVNETFPRIIVNSNILLCINNGDSGEEVEIYLSDIVETLLTYHIKTDIKTLNRKSHLQLYFYEAENKDIYIKLYENMVLECYNATSVEQTYKHILKTVKLIKYTERYKKSVISYSIDALKLKPVKMSMKILPGDMVYINTDNLRDKIIKIHTLNVYSIKIPKLQKRTTSTKSTTDTSFKNSEIRLMVGNRGDMEIKISKFQITSTAPTVKEAKLLLYEHAWGLIRLLSIKPIILAPSYNNEKQVLKYKSTDQVSPSSSTAHLFNVFYMI